MAYSRMPALFVGHGSPMNTLADNRATQVWRALGQRLPRPAAILMISAHWYADGLAVTTADAPETIYDWAARFEQAVRDCLVKREHASLVDYTRLGPDAQLAVPTPDHYLPLLYIAGAQHQDEPLSFPLAGIEMGSLSMLSVLVGEV